MPSLMLLPAQHAQWLFLSIAMLFVLSVAVLFVSASGSYQLTQAHAIPGGMGHALYSLSFSTRGEQSGIGISQAAMACHSETYLGI